MSERIFQSNNGSHSRNQKIAVLNIILNFILSRGWTDYDNFASNLTDRLLKSKPESQEDITGVLQKLGSSFFELNSVDRDRFIEAFPSEEVLRAVKAEKSIVPMTFVDVFTETITISVEEGKRLIKELERVSERMIQGALLDSLREKNATNPHERHSDTPLEIADLEHFTLPFKKEFFSFASVVKGYKSIAHKTVTWEDVSHQITKAYHGTHPDYLLVVLAKDPADGLITHFTNYARSVGNPNLIVMCDPVNLARFLRARQAI